MHANPAFAFGAAPFRLEPVNAYLLQRVFDRRGNAPVPSTSTAADSDQAVLFGRAYAGVRTPGTPGAAGAGYAAASATSLVTAGTGSKAFTTQTNLAYVVGSRVRATSVGSGDWMEGLVTAYSGTTLTITMDLNSGTGTHTDWSLSIAGQRGAAGANGSASTTEDTWANRPGSPVTGAVHRITDAPGDARWDGTIWRIRVGAFPVTPPVDASFAWVNQDIAVDTATGPFTTLSSAVKSAISLNCRVIAAPATPYKISAGFMLNSNGEANQSVGILFRESSTGKMHAIYLVGLGSNAAMQLDSVKFTNPTTVSATYLQITYHVRDVNFLRIEDNGTNRICSYSGDGINWTIFHTVSRIDFLTGGADQVGFFIRVSNATYPMSATFVHWLAQ